jgi:ATPase family associated with various cellular activities (AAA)
MAITESRTVTPSEARSRVKACFTTKRPVFLWGPPGIGKSELVEGITNELGGLMYDLRLGQMEPTDIRGIPFFNKNNEKMDWAPPVDLPDEETASQYPVIVLFLDEMNSAAPAVQAAGYQLILNRRIGKYKLPDNVVIVAAGNRESDKGVTYRMPSPLANRFVHLEVRPDFDSWFSWATQNRVHQDVVGYLSFSKGSLMDFDAKSASRAFATPRSWSFVSQFLKQDSISDDELRDLISGTVGEGHALSFMAHRKVAGSMPNPTDVLSGKVTELKVKEVSAMYSLTISLCYELEEQYKKLGKEKIADWHKQADNFLSFMMNNFTTELVVMGARVALTTYNLPMVPGKMKNFDEFHKRFGKYIIAASGK